MVLIQLEEHEVGLPTYRTSQASQYCAFAYKARGGVQRLVGPWSLGGLLTTKLVAASRERQVLRLEVVVGGKVLEEVALLLHDAVELVDVDLAIAITVGLVDHVLELLIVDVLTELLSHAGEVAERDLVGVVVIEELEHLLDVLAGVLLAHLGGHHHEELGELNGAVAVVVDIGDHLLQLLVLDLEAEGAHGGLELTDVDHAGGIGVEEGEGLADLIELLVGELTWLLLHGTAGHLCWLDR